MSELKISPELLQISPEVQDALKNKKPVVALESTIISHGMPFPQNAQTAIEVEETIRKQGAVLRHYRHYWRRDESGFKQRRN